MMMADGWAGFDGRIEGVPRTRGYLRDHFTWHLDKGIDRLMP